MTSAALDDLNWVDKQYGTYRQAEKTITFDGGTTNAIGDDGGTNDPFTIFTVTGGVLMKVFGICKTDLAGASATLEIGTAKSTAILIAQSTATDVDANEIWHDATPDNSAELSTVAAEHIVIQNVIGTVGTADITSGVIKFICLWKPITSDGDVTPA